MDENSNISEFISIAYGSNSQFIMEILRLQEWKIMGKSQAAQMEILRLT